MLLAFAKGGKTDVELHVREYTFEDFVSRLEKPKIGGKDGSYVIRGGLLKEPKRSDENLLEGELIVIDGDSRIDPETGEIISGAPPLPDAIAALDTMGIRYVAHTSHSYMPGEIWKYRVYIPAKLANEAELTASVDYLIEKFHSAGVMICPVPENTRWSQPWYLPRVKAELETSYIMRHSPLDVGTFDVATAMAWQGEKMAREAKERELYATRDFTIATGQTTPDDSNDLIRGFNRDHGLDWIRSELERNGYRFSYLDKRHNCYRFIRPGSSTGVAGVVVFRGKYDDWCVYSHHGAEDPLSDRVTDPFGLYALFSHGGDTKAAGRALYERSNRDRLAAFPEIKPLAVKVPIVQEAEDDWGEPGDDEAQPPAAPASRAGWEDELIVTKKGGLIWNMFNAAAVIRNAPAWAGVFAYDEFAGRTRVLKDIPGTATRDTYPRDVRDADFATATAWFNANGFPTAGKSTVIDAIDCVSRESVMHPVRAYLRSLKWDGEPRIGNWLRVYCGAEARDDDHCRYVDEAGLRWLISAVARVMRPGCKADSALIIEGQQGCGKSSMLRILAGQDWFGDSLPPFSSKDASSYLRGLWIIEMAELSNISKSEVEEIKAYITRTEERFRPAYGRSEVLFQRQCVFAGTTNADAYLRDETGNRRFWPVTVGHVDLEGLELDRDQIWAEAVARYDAGDPWFLSRDVIELSNQEQMARTMEDPWMGTIAEFLVGRSEVSIKEIAIDGLGFEVGRVSRMEANRIISVLRSMGWGSQGKFSDRTSGRRNMARYVFKGASSLA